MSHSESFIPAEDLALFYPRCKEVSCNLINT